MFHKSHSTVAAPFRTVLRVTTAVALLAVGVIGPGAPVSHAAPNTALILGPTVTPGSCDPLDPGGHCAAGQSLEQQQAEIAGFAVTVVTAAQWSAMTAAQFAAFQVLILGDPTCDPSVASSGDNSPTHAAAIANANVWEPVVTGSGGNAVVIGTDPTFHHGAHPGATKLERAGIAFAGQNVGATGAYVDLSCIYTFGRSDYHIPWLDGLSVAASPNNQFHTDSAPCFGNIAIVASSGPTSGLHDSDLSNWSCSVHESMRQWPTDWSPLALATDAATKPFCANDVDTPALACGQPYVLVRGAVVVSSEITLSPLTATNPVGTSHTVTATVTKSGSPQAGKTVNFIVASGPNAGRTGSCVTNAAGQCTFTYVGTGGPGTDQIQATFTADSGALESATASKTWTAAAKTPHSLAVDGTGFAEAANTADLNITGNWTVESWFKDEDPAGFNHDFRQIINKGDRNASPEAPYYILVGNGHLLGGVRSGGVDHPIDANLNFLGLDPSKWHHVAITYRADLQVLNLWLDGNHISFLSGVPNSAGNTLPVEIGRNGAHSDKFWVGKIDDVRIYNIARTGADISSDFVTELTGPPPANQVANWQFDESSGTSASDFADSHVATLNGGASFSTDHPQP